MTSYSAASGRVVAGGRYFTPSWRRAQSDGTWVAVPAINTLDDIDPEKDPAINTNHPGDAPWHAIGGQKQIIDAWCGACYDADNDELWFLPGGGHDDYAGNEIYRVSLRRDAPFFEMVCAPSGAIGNTGVLDDGLESSGVYFDGRPRSIHSYNKPVFAHGIGPIIAVQGNCYRSGQAGTAKPIIFSRDGSAVFGSANPYTTSSSGGGACWDSTRGVIYWRGKGTESVRQYDPDADTWSAVQTSGVTALSGYVGMAYSPGLDLVFVAQEDLTDGFGVFDPATGALTQPGATGSMVGCTLSGSGQPAWCDALGAFAFWDNSTDTGVVNLITPGADPTSDPWAISQLPVSGATIPTARTTNGTYGRFFYSSKLRGFGVINGVTEPIYFYALS